MASIYQPLLDRLAACPGDELTLRFAEIAAIIGRPLAPYARTEPAYWASRQNRVVALLEERGWWADLDAAEEAVTFRRGRRPVPNRAHQLDPLLAFLAAQEGETLRLSLDEIAAIMDGKLARMARLDPAWWDGRERRARRWEALGWTARLDIRGQAVVFTRGAMPDPQG
jgi:hypothetical protein